MADDKLIDNEALESISVAPGDPAREGSGNPDHPAQDPGQQAGQDASLAERLERDPEDEDAKLDVGLDETMDASDPPSVTQPGRDEPVPSSGFPG